MKCAIWNVNSVKARHDHVKRWLEENTPDILMVQELKGTAFPFEAFQAVGYEAYVNAQKAYNGVATFYKKEHELVKVSSALDDLGGSVLEKDEQARYLETCLGETTFINIYLPNGNPVETDKYTYKLEWMERLYKRLFKLYEERRPFVIGGDFNVIPEDKDCYDPAVWMDDALFKIETRNFFRKILNMGLYDAFRMFNQDPAQYTFWDYQAGCWPQNKGIRIDHFLVSPYLADRVISCTVDSGPRGWDKPSDHTPVILEMNLD